METVQEQKSADHEHHYAILADALSTQNRANVFRSMGCTKIQLLGEQIRRGQVQISICFLPKRRASIDQAPGPIIANVPPKTASMTEIQISLPPVKTIQSSTAATSAPAIGVQSPTTTNNPRTAPIISGIIRPATGVPSCTIPLTSRAIPVRSR
jgi:hypothetical protein